MAKKNVAQFIVETLVQAGVRRVYGVTGDSLNGITEALRVHPNIDWVHVRHEEVGAFAAGAEAHLTGELVVCAGSCGPGNMHLINGLYDCHKSRVPVLAIAAQIPSREIGSSYFQETNPEKIFAECSHCCEVVTSHEQMPRSLEIAIQTALTKRGVAVLVLPGDVAMQEVPANLVAHIPALKSHALSRPADDDLNEMTEVLNSSDKVTILAGAGCVHAHDELIQVADLLKAPIVHTLRGKEFIEYNNPYDVGMTGLIGYSSGYHAMLECDTLLMLGTDFPYRQFYPTDSKIIQIDMRGENIGRRAHVDYGYVGDVKATLLALMDRLENKQDRKHLDRMLKNYREAREDLNELAEGKAGSHLIHPQYLTKVLNEIADEDAIFTCDVGTPTVWAARYLKMNGQRRLLGSFNHGSMANALPQAIGAQLTFPERQVISLSGDGGFSMLMGDVLSLKQLKIPVKIIIFNNSSLSFVEMEMKVGGQLNYGTELENPDFAKMAESIGIHGVRIEDPEDLEKGLREALAFNGPAIIDVVVNRMELTMPPHIELDQAWGFSLFMAKAVLNGRGSEVLDLAKTNWFHRN